MSACVVTSNRGNRWSQLTIRIGECNVLEFIFTYIHYFYYCAALAVFTRSPCAYEALRSFKLLQLPCVRTLKHYIDANMENPGDSADRLRLSRKQYLSLIEEKERAFDERKDTASSQANGLLGIQHTLF